MQGNKIMAEELRGVVKIASCSSCHSQDVEITYEDGLYHCTCVECGEYASGDTMASAIKKWNDIN